MSRARDIANLQSSKITADFGIDIDNITIDGTEIDLSSGNLTIDVAGQLVVNSDAGQLVFQDGSDNIGELANHSGDFGVNALGQNKHILFKGNDGGNTITALTLDMSDAGAATFNSGATFGGAGRFDNSNSTPVRLHINNSGSNDYASIYADTATAFKNLVINPDGGNVMIGTTTAGLANNGDQLTVSDSGNTGITIRSTNSGQNNIYFSDGTSSSEQFIGYITYQHDVNAMRFGTNDSEAIRIDSSGNVGIGTSDPNSYSNLTTLTINGTNGGVLDFERSGTVEGELVASSNEFGVGAVASSGVLTLRSGGNTERMRIKSDGEVQVASANDGGGRIFRVQNTSNTANSTARMIIQTGGSSGGDAFITFDTHNSLETYMLGVDKTDQRFCLERQDAGAFDGTNRALDVDANGKFRIFNTAADYSLNVRNSQANANNVYGQFIQFTGVSADNRDSEYLIGADTSTTRFKIYGDGDIENHDNSYGSLSDERIKQDIVDANSQWDDIKAIKIRNYKKKDDINEYGDKATSQIGVIAQELETVSPNLIKENLPTVTDIKHSAEFGTLYTKDDAETQDAVLYTSDDEEVKSGDKEVGDVKTSSTKQIGDVKEVKQKVKGVKYSVLYMKAVKALQEAMTRIETLEAKVAKLEGA